MGKVGKVFGSWLGSTSLQLTKNVVVCVLGSWLSFTWFPRGFTCYALGKSYFCPEFAWLLAWFHLVPSNFTHLRKRRFCIGMLGKIFGPWLESAWLHSGPAAGSRVRAAQISQGVHIRRTRLLSVAYCSMCPDCVNSSYASKRASRPAAECAQPKYHREATSGTHGLQVL